MSFSAALGAEFPLLLFVHAKIFCKYREIEQLIIFPPQHGVVLVAPLRGVDLLIEPDGPSTSSSSSRMRGERKSTRLTGE